MMRHRLTDFGARILLFHLGHGDRPRLTRLDRFLIFTGLKIGMPAQVKWDQHYILATQGFPAALFHIHHYYQGLRRRGAWTFTGVFLVLHLGVILNGALHAPAHQPLALRLTVLLLQCLIAGGGVWLIWWQKAIYDRDGARHRNAGLADYFRKYPEERPAFWEHLEAVETDLPKLAAVKRWWRWWRFRRRHRSADQQPS